MENNNMKNNVTKNIILTVLMALVILGLFAGTASADVSVTAATGGGTISADDFGSGAWTTLGSIVMEEGATTDFGIGADVTIILTAPTGFEFNTLQVPNAASSGADITSITTPVDMTSSTITITYTVGATSTSDSITIGGSTAIQVRPTAGTPLASGNILRTDGTAVVTGITGSTNFGTLQEVHGAADHLVTVSPTGPQTAGATFLLTSIKAYDQYGNILYGTNGAPAYTGDKND